MPIGRNPNVRMPESGGQPEGDQPPDDQQRYQPPPNQAPPPARSPDYSRVLDRYISRLVSLKRVRDAVALYRKEIDRNPNDPGLYERLAVFLDQNKMAAEVEQVYTRATQQFQDKTWSHKLARWYLRRKQTAKFDQLTKDVAGKFSGTDLEKYFVEAIGPLNVNAVLYRHITL